MTNTYTRPLKDFSDYIVEELPEALKVKRNPVLGSRLEELSGRALEIIEDGDLTPESAEVAHLDLHMAASGLRKKHMPLSPRLSATLEAINAKTKLPNGITYQDLVMSNPVTDPRHFLAGEDGEEEERFYRAQAMLETSASNAVLNIRTGEPFQDQVLPHVEDFNAHTESLLDCMSVMGYARMLPYYRNEGGLPDADARYSASPYVLRAFGLSDAEFEERKAKVAGGKLKLYPSPMATRPFLGQIDMQMADDERKKFELNPEDKKTLAEELQRFREIHKRIILRYAPSLGIASVGTGVRNSLHRLSTLL